MPAREHSDDDVIERQEPAVTPAGAGAIETTGAVEASVMNGEVQRPPRVIVERVYPEIDAGRFAAKRTLGETFTVEADIIVDGHDRLRAMLLCRGPGEMRWNELEMQPLGNDRWAGDLPFHTLGEHRYTVVAWIDRFGSWRTDLEKWVTAGRPVASELLEGAGLVEDAARHAGGDDAAWLNRRAAELADQATPEADRIVLALDERLLELMHAHEPRADQARYPRDLPLRVDPVRARWGTWYEMFPRSAGATADRSATFREAAERLPDIARMGFDVLYLPPVNPIGHTNRKGPNNALRGGPGDPGSPWAIGSEAGGHTAIHPELGTIDDFDWFVAEAKRRGLDIALDFAIQVSPDHPWVRDHPSWFRHRPDGSIKYAQNPPKEYQDIYPVNFDTEDWWGLWQELRNVVLFWIDHGVRIFRVDNPHTKPFPFWEWLISEVLHQHPDVVFLSEAFSRPRIMEGLAKRGFHQSYTYFTWRNSKPEIEAYFRELAETEVKEYLRPNLFVNTPDILHEYLQRGGRPAFLARLVLAATLSPTYGVYSGFELLERVAVAAGSEEYLDSEKYQIRARDWDAPGNIKAFLQRVNDIRASVPALQHRDRTWFLPIADPEIVAFLRSTPDDPRHVLVAVNVDVEQPRRGWVGVPVHELGIGADEEYRVHDMLSDDTFTFRGEWNEIDLDPAVSPARILVFEAPPAQAAETVPGEVGEVGGGRDG